MSTCPECGNPAFAPHTVGCPKYTPDMHRVDGHKALIDEWRRNATNIRLVLPDHGEAAVWDHCADELERLLSE